MGFFKVTVGVMGSSKSARAIAEVQNLKIRGLKTYVIKPALDTRDGAYICSRLIKDKVSADLLIKPNESILYENIKDKEYDYIVVDEFHMLSEKQIEDLYTISATTPINVSMYGLRMSWKGTPFKSAALALGYADEIEMMTMVDREQNELTHHVKYEDGMPAPINSEDGTISVGDLGEISYKTVSKRDFYLIYNNNIQKK